MGNTVVPGPNTVVMYESGNGRNCDCGPPKFDVEGAKNDNRLLGMFGQARVHAKLDSLNERYPSVAPSSKIWLGMVPFMVCGGIFMGLVKPHSSVSCDRAYAVCDASTPTSSCNVLWCCPHGYDRYEINGGRGPGPEKYVSDGCYQVYGNTSVVPKDPDRGNFADFCAKGKDGPIAGCNCDVSRRSKGGERWRCNAVFIDGQEGNYFFTASNIAWTLLCGVALFQLGWILPLCWFCKKQNAAAAWLRNDHFADWIDQGVSLHYTKPTKHTPGALSLTLPSGYVSQGQPIIVVPAQVATTGLDDKY